MIYRLDDFTENNINPINNKPYDSSWIVLMLTDSADYQYMCGSFDGCAYTVKISRMHSGWEFSVCDFLGFHEAAEKNIIAVISPEDLQSAKEEYGTHSYNDSFLRNNEPQILVHSTTLKNFEKIKKDGSLKSRNILNNGEFPIGNLLGDPEDFGDYIMFSGGNVAGEIVVNSKQSGKIIMDENAEYKTGARLYFDAAKIAADGLLLRDGAHLKVKNSLPLEPYLIWLATWENTGLPDRISTPKIFTETANNEFLKFTGYKFGF